MSAVVAVLRGRVAAAALMLDTCTVRRPTGALVTDPETGVDTPEMLPVYPIGDTAGICKVQSAIAQAGSPVAGGHMFTVEQLELHLPVSSSLRAGDVATITAAALDPDLVGLKFRLVELARGSLRTADRWNVELVTG
jgi:hypothetical protein